MTVSSQVTKVTAAGNSLATSFSFSPLVIFQSSDIVVTKVASDGTETTLVEGVGSSNYAVVVASYPGTGSITYPASGATTLATGESVVMRRVLTIEQLTQLGNQGGYFPDVQEAAFDRLTMVDLQQEELLDRAIKFAVEDVTAPIDLPSAALRAGKALVFDGSGQVTAGSISGTAVSTAMQPVVQAATLVLARAAMGLNTIPKVTVFRSSGTWSATTGMRYAMLLVKGSGASGGGSVSATINGGGGGEGEIAFRLVDATTLGASQTVTIGAGGVAVALNTPATGNGGNTTSIGTVLTAHGGLGGAPGGSGGQGGSGGTGGSNADFAFPGSHGFPGADAGGATVGLNSSGGGAGGGNFAAAGAANSGGGGGGGNSASASGAGGTGIAVVIEFF